jgi:hypothetical protein
MGDVKGKHDMAYAGEGATGPAGHDHIGIPLYNYTMDWAGKTRHVRARNRDDAALQANKQYFAEPAKPDSQAMIRALRGTDKR